VGRTHTDLLVHVPKIDWLHWLFLEKENESWEWNKGQNLRPNARSAREPAKKTAKKTGITAKNVMVRAFENNVRGATSLS
jgi:hypothetical protein